jgi:hypothetical protein
VNLFTEGPEVDAAILELLGLGTDALALRQRSAGRSTKGAANSVGTLP